MSCTVYLWIYGCEEKSLKIESLTQRLRERAGEDDGGNSDKELSSGAWPWWQMVAAATLSSIEALPWPALWASATSFPGILNVSLAPALSFCTDPTSSPHPLVLSAITLVSVPFLLLSRLTNLKMNQLWGYHLHSRTVDGSQVPTELGSDSLWHSWPSSLPFLLYRRVVSHTCWIKWQRGKGSAECKIHQ